MYTCTHAHTSRTHVHTAHIDKLTDTQRHTRMDTHARAHMHTHGGNAHFWQYDSKNGNSYVIVNITLSHDVSLYLTATLYFRFLSTGKGLCRSASEPG